jgi:hypothetical protein
MVTVVSVDEDMMPTTLVKSPGERKGVMERFGEELAQKAAALPR